MLFLPVAFTDHVSEQTVVNLINLFIVSPQATDLYVKMCFCKTHEQVIFLYLEILFSY